ncbi:AAA family ATPase [Marinobacteraceae bacterium S3BR75-40.1]
MNAKEALSPEQLFESVDTSSWSFETSDELENLDGVVGQERALEAIEFGIGVPHSGFNLFVLGPAASGSREIVKNLLADQAAGQEMPWDWCYVHNFEHPHKPRALRLPAGDGVRFRSDMDALVRDLLSAIPATFESDEYRAQRHEVEQAFKDQRESALKGIEQDALAQDIALVRTPTGFVFVPRKDDEAMSTEQFKALPDEEQARITGIIDSYRQRLAQFLEQLPQWRREEQQQIQALDHRMIQGIVGQLIQVLHHRYRAIDGIPDYLAAVEKSVVENAGDFVASEEQTMPALLSANDGQGADTPALRRYRVNVVVDHSHSQGAPLVMADNPAYPELLGRVEHESRMGTLVTNFTLIKPGALHLANGGYLVIDARQLLMQPFAWEGLKRCLYAQQIRIESPAQMLPFMSTISLEPEPIPLNVKVVLIGERLIYYMLYHYDPDFRELFKVAADFDDEVMRSPETQLLQARLIATLARREHLLPFHRSALARLLEHSSRMAGDQDKLSICIRNIKDLLCEADYWARRQQDNLVEAAHIKQAIDARIRRSDRLRNRHQELIEKETLLIATEGAVVGQINGLSVVSLGDFEFGVPTRISASVRLGSGKVVDIQREVSLGGPIHSKGVLILSGFLGSRYCADSPLSLAASLVFEQTYGEVEGDSASCAELCVLLSALAGVPIKQSFAMTGSVSQHGEVQAIGGVNEKIEGYFDVCARRGLTGEQGVIIPAANARHLMLRDDVVQACREQRFRVFAVSQVDEALELLTGIPSGTRNAKGSYPKDSFNARVEERLATFAREARKFGAPEKTGKKAD